MSQKKKELETQIQTIKIYIQDIRMEFDIEKWVFIIRGEKKLLIEEIEQPNQEK